MNSYDSRIIKKPLPKQVKLKDYLLDDMSSCSSNGFRSFPRRQCCATVRFLMDSDLRAENSKQKLPKTALMTKNKSSSALIMTSAVAVLNAAAKLLPKKLKRSFWKRRGKEIQRWKSFKYLGMGSDRTIVVNAVTENLSNSNNSSSNSSNGKSESESSNYFSTSGNSDDVATEEEESSERGGGIDGGDSNEATAASTPTSSKDNWKNMEEKQQFSPVSVLDFPTSTDEDEVNSPLEDEDDEVSSPFKSRLACVEGRKKKLMQKLQRFEGLAQLKPIDLAKKFSLTEETNESPEHNNTNIEEEEEDEEQQRPEEDEEDEEDEEEEKEKENEIRQKAILMLDNMKTTLENFDFSPEIILFDFFVEGVVEANGSITQNKLVNEAKDWINGNPQEVYLGWEVEQNRLSYIRSMEKEGKWKRIDEHKEEVAFELEAEVLAQLVNELVLDLI